MKRLSILFICLCLSLAGIAQNVGIGTNTPNASAVLELQSTNKGLLLPRVADTNAIANPAKGLVVYSTTANALFYYNGSSWQSTANSGSGDFWYKYQDSILSTSSEYVSINPNPDFPSLASGLSVSGNLVVAPASKVTNDAPTPAQTFIMNNTTTLQTFQDDDSTGRVFDPAGQNINYVNSMQGSVTLGGEGPMGVNFSFNSTDFGLAAGDTLWIGYVDFPDCRTYYQVMLTNTTVAPADFNLPGASSMYIVFKSNSDGINSKGFDITWKKIFRVRQVVSRLPGIYGSSLVFNAQTGSFQVGGKYKIGYGAGCIGCGYAEGINSFAASLGGSSGRYASAFNDGDAYGDYSFAAVGGRSIGRYSTAIGQRTIAKSRNSTAIGSYNDTLTGTSELAWRDTDPLVYVGNGHEFSDRSNAMVIYKNANVDINGYTRLGKLSEGAPVIKMKELSGTTSGINNGSVSITHGLNSAKIISVQALVEYSTGNFVPTAYTYAPELHFNYLVQTGSILIVNNASTCTGTSICNKPVKILITYKE